MRREIRNLIISGVLAGIVALPALSAARQKGGLVRRDSKVRLLRAPDGGIQPQALVDRQGVLHLIYFSGDPAAGNIFYVRREPGGENFSSPIRVNSQPGSAVAVGTIRGAHLALGKGGRIHVSWNGSKDARPRGPANEAPMLYTRLNDRQTGFEPQRNVMQFSGGLDGGGSVAADADGNVYVAWHGKGSIEGEAHRRVWVARSTDDGKTFVREEAAFSEETGACGCCGMRAFVDGKGTFHILYRAATGEVNRDMVLLCSRDKGKSYTGVRVDQWKLSVCPMSSAVMADGENGTLLAWETEGRVYYGEVRAGVSKIAAAEPGVAGNQKHPSIASNARGERLLAWTEGTGWKRGGSLVWQLFDSEGKPIGEKCEAPGVPVWGLVSVVSEKDGRFTIMY
jgi:hypothetical protein